MTDELKKIIFSPQISKVFCEHNWVINTDPKNKYQSYFVGDIADYYLNVYLSNGKIYLQFTLDLEIPENKINELLILINIANQNSKEGFFVFDFKICKIKYNLISFYPIKTEECFLDDFLKIKLDFTKSLFYNFVSGVHNLVYGEKIESASLELLFLNNEGCA
jgi:hypothetical protein